MQFRDGTRLSNSPYQLVTLQVALVNAFRLFIQFLIMPFGEQTFFPQMMGGIAIGPSFLGQIDAFYHDVLYSPKGMLMIGIFRAMGFMFLLFLLSVRLDLTILKKCGKLAVVIGIASLVVPLIVTTLISCYIRELFGFDKQLYRTLPSVAFLVSTTSFHVILVVLTDLKLVNSELGRLALSSSMISGIISWAFLASIFDVVEDLQLGIKEGILIFAQLSKFIIILIIIFVLRPIMFWMVKQTPDGISLKEPFVCAICLMVLSCALLGEVTGQHFYFAPVILGMATPHGPTLVSSLIEKLDGFVEAVFVPCYIIDAGTRTNIFLIGPKNFAVVELMMIIAFLVKFVSVIIPSLYFKMPFRDALSLSFILNSKGLFDVQLFSRANKVRLITNENYAILVVASAIHSAICTWSVRMVYDPSRRYVAYQRRTIQSSAEHSSELRILACIHKQDDVPSIISILEDSNATKEEPIGVYVMNLKRSVGGTVPLLISHQLNAYSSSTHKHCNIDHIINAFCQIERRKEGLSMINFFTSCAPYPTLHDAVCSMAQEKAASLIILPFRRSDDDPSIRIVNRNILYHAPCTVGILFDCGKLNRSVLPCHAMKRVCVVFLGGPDDRETLAFGTRLAMHPYIVLTVIRLVSENLSDSDLIEKRRDLNTINEFRVRAKNSKKKVRYKEYTSFEGSETATLLREVCRDYELILVGRRHDPSTALLSGLLEWREIDELGVVGDMLASSDFDCRIPVLVVQQQASVVQQMIDTPKNISKNVSFTFSDWPRSSDASTCR